MYVLTVNYPLDLYPEFDARLVGLIGYDSCMSGAGDGWRDISWEFEILKEAERVKEKLLGELGSISVTINEDRS